MTPTIPRIWRYSYSAFGKALRIPDDMQDESVTAAKAYTDDVLADIAAAGFNAIWVHGLMRNMVKSSVFPEFGRNSRVHIRNMRDLIRRAEAHGLGVYLYMQPPRGLRADDPFWRRHPDVGGPVERWMSDDGKPVVLRAFCTSTPPVKAYLRESSERLMREMPGLSGVILITASEYCSHCCARRRGAPSSLEHGPAPDNVCPRCAQRHAAEVIAEIIQLVRHGVRAASRDAHVIAWNWSWNRADPDPSPNIIKRLPKDVILVCGFERGSKKTILGKERRVDEYSLSYAGPSERFVDARRVAQRCGLRTMAKLQIGTTHELATVPNLPLIGNLHEKARQMRRLKVSGFMGAWNFGNMLTANTAAFNRFMTAKRLLPRRRALEDFARVYLPGCDAAVAAEAWERFAEAMDSYPFSIPFLYASCVNWSLGYPLKPGQAKDTGPGRSWHADKRGEQLSHGDYTLTETIRGLGRVARGWKPGARMLEEALAAVGSPEAQQETDNAWVCYHIFRSAWNSYRAFRLRKRWTDGKLPAYLRIIRDELANIEAALPRVERDPRFGFHIEAHAYMFDAASIRRKIRSLKRQLSRA